MSLHGDFFAEAGVCFLLAGGEVRQLAVTDGLLDSRVSVEEADGKPPRVMDSGRSGFDERDEFADRALKGGRSLNAEGTSGSLSGGDGFDGREKGTESLARPRGDGDGWHAKFPRETSCIHYDTLAPRLVHEIDRENRPVGNFQHLKREVQVAFQCGRIGDDDNAVRLPEEDEIAGDFFILRGGEKRVSAGQINEFVANAVKFEAAFRAGDGFSGPVAGCDRTRFQ